jgi:two-component system chemotaxis response regulator CheY
MKVLVVDDELMNRLVLQKVLSRYAEVDSRVDGQEAVLAFRGALDRGDPYDLVCMDVFMPNMGGIEALKLIRQAEELYGRFRPLATKVVITTASDDTDIINQAFHELCDAYVVKPIDAREIIDIVHCLLPLEERSV